MRFSRHVGRGSVLLIVGVFLRGSLRNYSGNVLVRSRKAGSQLLNFRAIQRRPLSRHFFRTGFLLFLGGLGARYYNCL